MNLKTFFEHFDTLAEAPNGIQRLRELILDMAVRGKLVPQDPEDEPVEKLLSILESQKKGLRKKGKIPQQKKLYSVTPEEFLFEIPASWSWERMAYIFDVRDGTHDTPQYVSEGIPFLTSKNISSGKLDFESCKFIREVDHIEFSKRSHVEKGDIIFAMIGSIGNPVLVDTDKEFSIKNVALFKSFLPQDMDLNFLKVYLDYATNLMKDSSSGAVQRFVSLTFLRNYPFPLPPLAEQKRIVAKVDELMALCDALEAAQQTRNTLRQKLRASALDGLMNAPSNTDLETAWAFVRDNWGLMCDQPEDVEGLRQVVLQVAVQGRLVQQNSQDEHAQVLKARIETEKKKLQRDRVIPKCRPMPSIEASEKLFQIPNNWCWCRWNDVAFHIGDVDHKMPTEIKDGIPYVSPRDFGDGNSIDFTGAKKISLEDFNRLSAKIQPKLGDIIFPRYGTIGENRLVETGINFLASYSCAVIKTAQGFIDPRFQFYYSISHIVKNEIQRYTNKTTQANVGIKSIQNFIFPLPPLAEQKRIVAKVDELMKLCDHLEASLRQQQETAQALAASALCLLGSVR